MPIRLVPGLALTLLLSGMLQPARADEALTTDRPDFSESPEVVGAGRFQIETSVAFERDKREGTHTRSTPTLLRLGVSKAWELRVETDGLMRQRSSVGGTTETVSGTSDTALGVKWHMQDGDEDDGKPSIAWLFHVDMDTGSPAFRGQGLRPSLRMVSEWEYDGGWSLGVMPGIYSDKNAQGERFVGGLLALALSKQLTPKLSAVAEFAAKQVASRKNGGNVFTFDPAIAYLLSDTAQIDFGIDFGLNRNAPDTTAAIGLSLKF